MTIGDDGIATRDGEHFKRKIDIEEREAAVCPEDMGFEEYIKILKDALRPFAAMCRDGDDPDEAVLVRQQDWILNRDLARASRLVGAPNQ